MILNAKILEERERATLFKFYNSKELIYKTSWVPNSVISDIEINAKEESIIEVDIADWFCIKNGWDKV